MKQNEMDFVLCFGGSKDTKREKEGKGRNREKFQKSDWYF